MGQGRASQGVRGWLGLLPLDWDARASFRRPPINYFQGINKRIDTVVREGRRALHAKNVAAGGRWAMQKHPIWYKMVLPEHLHPWAGAAFPPLLAWHPI